MSSIEAPQKYVYKFYLQASSKRDAADEPSKQEVQAYINDILGVVKPKSPRDTLTV